jgi:two-component system, OmpR family, response regulator MprA
MADILIVDDEPSITLALSMILTDEGYSIRTAANGAEARELLKHGAVDLIVSDVMMPVVDGITFVQELRGRGDHTPVVLMSAAPGRFAEISNVRHVAKPFDLDCLLFVIQDSLRTNM